MTIDKTKVLTYRFARIPNGPKNLQAVYSGMRETSEPENNTFIDRAGNYVSIPRNTFGQKTQPWFDDGYARCLWDFMHGDLLLGERRSNEEHAPFYVRDIDMSGENKRFKTWHAIPNLETEYHVAKAKAYTPWNDQMRVECSKLEQRVLRGIKFNNRAYRRTLDGVKILKHGDEKFEWPYEIVIDQDYDKNLVKQAAAFLSDITLNEHSAKNLARMFATPELERNKQLTYVMYGDGGNGKSVLLDSLKQSFPKIAASIDTQRLLGKGFDQPQETRKLAGAIWAFDGDADTITLDQLTYLKKLSSGDTLTARRIGENSYDVNPKCTFIVATNKDVITESNNAIARRFVYVRMRDGRQSEEFKPLIKFRDKYGAIPFIMLSCYTWAYEGDEPYTDVSIGNPKDVTDQEQDVIDTICMNEVAPTSLISELNRHEQRNIIAKLGLERTGTMWSKELNKAIRGLRVKDELRFSSYRQAWEENQKQLHAQMIQPRPEPIDDVDVLPSDLGFACDYVPADANKVARNWKKLSADPAQDTSRPPQVPVHGVVPSPGFMIIDMDMGVDGVADGWETLQNEVGAYGTPSFPTTYLVGTPSGGTHAYYRIPENLQGHLKNRVHANGVPVDVRAEGKGYVIGAGSQTTAGEYRVLDLPETQIPELSPQLVQWFATHGYVDGVEQADAPLPAIQSAQIVSHTPGVLPSLDEVMTQVSESRRGEPDMAPIPVGQRNQMLHDWAYGRFVHYPEDGERIVAETFDRGRRSGLPDTEIMTILGSIKRQLGGAQ